MRSGIRISMPKVYVETYGCTLNQADSDIIKALLMEKYLLVDDGDGCDVMVINTCTVKGATENKICERIKTLAQRGARLVIAGCLTVNRQRLRKLAPAAPLVAPSSLQHICDAVEDALAGRPGLYDTPGSKENLPKRLTAPIARIPINEGCTSNCHFCQTRFARPYLRSYSPKTVVNWINAGVRSGAREIQLTSMDSGAYGIDLRTDLKALLSAIVNDDSSGKVDGNPAFLVRLGMINPNHAKRMLPAIIQALRCPRFYKFLHVPVQTGSEKVCKEMNRDHSVRDFIDIVSAVREAVPDVTIATDIIVGYPTESEADFQETLKLIQDTKPELVNLSRFTARPGTRAKQLRQLQNAVIKQRSAEAMRLIRKVEADANRPFIGKTVTALMTEKTRDYKGRTAAYRQVVVKGFKGKLGEFIDVKIADANHGSLFGKIIRFRG